MIHDWRCGIDLTGREWQKDALMVFVTPSLGLIGLFVDEENTSWLIKHLQYPCTSSYK